MTDDAAAVLRSPLSGFAGTVDLGGRFGDLVELKLSEIMFLRTVLPRFLNYFEVIRGAWARAVPDAQHGANSHDLEPRSLRGAFLVAAMMERRDVSGDRLTEIKRRLPVGGIEEGILDAIVFDTLVRRIFPEGFDAAKVEQFVTDTVELFPEEHKPEQALTKALIQYTLEESQTRRDVIKYLEPARIIGILVVVIARRLALSEAEVTKLVAEAERQAEHEGVSLVPLIEP